ncbi:hypothetical protein LRS05_00100, partial [Flavobacterium sp. J372]
GFRISACTATDLVSFSKDWLMLNTLPFDFRIILVGQYKAYGLSRLYLPKVFSYTKRATWSLELSTMLNSGLPTSALLPILILIFVTLPEIGATKRQEPVARRAAQVHQRKLFT